MHPPEVAKQVPSVVNTVFGAGLSFSIITLSGITNASSSVPNLLHTYLIALAIVVLCLGLWLHYLSDLGELLSATTQDDVAVACVLPLPFFLMFFALIPASFEYCANLVLAIAACVSLSMGFASIAILTVYVEKVAKSHHTYNRIAMFQGINGRYGWLAAAGIVSIALGLVCLATVTYSNTVWTLGQMLVALLVLGLLILMGAITLTWTLICWGRTRKATQRIGRTYP